MESRVGTEIVVVADRRTDDSSEAVAGYWLEHSNVSG